MKAYPVLPVSRCLTMLLLWFAQAAMSPAIAVTQATSDIPPGLGITPDGRAGTPVNTSIGKLIDPATHEVSKPVALEVERIVWDKAPLPITLSVGQERMVTFPGNVRLGIPASVSPHLRTQSQRGTVYWLAEQAFASTRIQVQDLQSGQFYLVDLSASAKAHNNAPLEIINSTPDISNKAASPNTPAMPLPDDPNRPVAPVIDTLPWEEHKPAASDYLILTRYAAQQLFAPARLLKTPPGIHPAPLDLSVLGNDTLLRGGNIWAEPLAAWRKGRLYVTAVKLTNRSAQPVMLDPRLLRGVWRTATFQHGHLGASFTQDNVTALYLVSDRPFEEAI